MAQPHQQYPPRNYSPLPRTDSPHHSPPGPYPPPKRQRLSPNSQSPYSSPSMANIALPNQVFSSPYFGNQGTGAPHNNNYTSNHHYGSPAINPYNTSPTYGSPAGSPYPHNNAYSNMNNAYNTMNAPPQSGPQPAGQSRPTGTMGPPSRPDDKPTDINELEDVLMGSGVDLKEEEAALLNSYRQAGQQRQETGHISNAAGFGQSYSVPRENFYSQNVPGGRNTFYGAGSFNQRPSPYQSTEAMLASDRKQAERRKAAIQSYHLNDSFLFTGSLYRRIVKQAQGMQAKLPPHDSVLQRQSRPDMPPTELTVSGPDKNEVLKVVKGQELLCMNSPYVELLSLLSLAAEERIRGLVEDAATLAKGRRIGSHGVVPADLASLAVGNGTSETVAGLPTPSNSAVSPKSNPLKRSYAETNKPLTPISNNSQTPSSTILVANPVAQALQKISRAERTQEEERLAKRQRRAAAGDVSRSVSLGGSGPGTPGYLGEQAPDIDTKKSGKAGDPKKAAASKATEAQQHAATTKTMNMALGLSGAMGKKLSWMTKGADTGPTNPFLPKVNTNASGSKAPGSNANGISTGLPRSRVFGEFREDKETGAGIQLRDIVSVLENDGKEKKALQRAYGKLGVQRR